MVVRRSGIENQIFNFLRVIEFSHIDKGRSYWKCKCLRYSLFKNMICGNTTIVASNLLGKTKSCGCLFIDSNSFCKIRKKSMLISSVSNHLIRKYKHRAKKNGWEFNLTTDLCYILFTSSCSYCGDPPSNCHKIPRDRSNRIFKYSGIDRIDSSKGYIKGNVRSCCRFCNILKSNKSEQEFKEWLKRVNRNYADSALYKMADNEVKKFQEEFRQMDFLEDFVYS